MEESRFNQKIKPVLKYVGTIGAVLTGIAYITIVMIMIFGFAATGTLTQTFIFAVINALMGLIIMQLLKVQGIDFAKDLKTNKELLDQYYNTKTKDKKFRSLKWFWGTSIIKDVIIKCLTIAITTFGIIYIVICGTNNYSYLLLALVNLIMFACFGLLSLVKAYEFFNNEYIPYIKEKINETERLKAEAIEKEAAEREKTIETEVQRRVALAKKEFDKQRDDMVHSDRGSDILEPSMDMCSSCADNQSMVLECGDGDNPVLGGTVYTSSNVTDRTDPIIKENISQNLEEKEC